jgi:hypothetical protein
VEKYVIIWIYWKGRYEEGVMAEERILGLTSSQIEKISDSIYARVDGNHPIASNSYNGFIKAVDEGAEKALSNKDFMKDLKVKD